MSVLYKNSSGDVVSLIPEINNIDDSTVAADTTYSSEKIEGSYPITTTATGTDLTLSTSAGNINALTVYGKSEVVDGSIKSAGDSGSIEIETCEKNLFDPTKLVTENITYTDGILSGTASAFYNAYSAGTPILFNKSKQITFSAKIYTNGAYAESNGLVVSIVYTDNTYSALYIPNNTTEPQFFTLTSNATKQIKYLAITFGSAGYNIWYLSEIQLEYGSIATAYEPYNGTMAVFETGTPLRATLDGTVKDEMHYNGITGEVITRCEIVNDEVVPLATPITTPLTQAENDSIAGLRTFEPNTHISNNAGTDMAVEAYTGTENGKAVQELENRIKSEIDEVKNERSHFCYSYKIDMNNSDPATCVKPHFDTRYGCDNFNFTSAHMDYANDRFEYGSWEGFIRRIARPCMLKYDGTVDYYLDPDDYSKKITGEASDVADVNYQGNAMVELEKLYFKRYTYNGIQYCFIADRKLDKSFKCWAHHDKYGKELDYIYRACYDGMYDGTRLRSISGIDYHNLNALTAGYIMSNTTRQEEMNFAKANNVSTEQGEGWNILHKSEWDYINDILVLISMSTDTQGTFGRGRDGGYVSTSDTGIISTGTMDTKGLFWGKNDSTAGVKVLGIENHWANLFKSCAGWMLISNQHYTKMTFGTEDGSTGTGFNTDGTGYLATGASISANGNISDWAENDNGFLPTAASGSASTYRCDYVWQNTATYFALVGGLSSIGLQCGAFCASLSVGAGSRGWSVGTALSYKPLAGGELAA